MSLKVGDKAIDFTLHDIDKKQRTLKEFIGKKTVIAFYPGAFSGVCTKEMCTLRDWNSMLGSLNAQVVAISIDSPLVNKAFAELNKLNFPVLCDYTREVSKQYCGLYDNFAGLPGLPAAKRSVFILDASGIITYAWISETNPGADPPFEEIKAALN